MRVGPNRLRLHDSSQVWSNYYLVFSDLGEWRVPTYTCMYTHTHTHTHKQIHHHMPLRLHPSAYTVINFLPLLPHFPSPFSFLLSLCFPPQKITHLTAAPSFLDSASPWYKLPDLKEAIPSLYWGPYVADEEDLVGSVTCCSAGEAVWQSVLAESYNRSARCGKLVIMPRWAEPRRHTVVVLSVSVCLLPAFCVTR